MHRKPNGKFEFVADNFKDNPRLEKIGVQTQCDFDLQPAINGRINGTDAFYFCQHHSKLVEMREEKQA